MSLFGTNQTSIRYGALIEIGSGSVLVAIVASDPTKNHPDIIWSKREHSPLRGISSISDTAKNVMTSLLNALMLLDSEGRGVMHDKTGKNKLPETQVTITAPWSYTVTKSILYTHDEPFPLSKDLVEELLRAAHTKVSEELAENQAVHDFGLSVITRSASGLIANGYSVRLPNNQLVKNLKIIESSAVVQDYLIDALHDVQAKILPGTSLYLYSFILVFYSILSDLVPETNEFCLVDVTYEATEVGIVRDGVLTYCTHTPFGSFALAREIADVLKVPLEEAFGYLHEEDPLVQLSLISPARKKEIEQILTNFQERITNLFHETGDALSIPKIIYLHGDKVTENFFRDQISSAAKAATKTSHAVTLVSKELLEKFYTADERNSLKNEHDTALLISSQFFHTESHHSKFEQL